MANEIKLVTYANSEVTPQNDAVLTNLEIASNGVIFGCNVTIKNASTLHINAGMGVVYGREFEIVDSDIPVSLSSSGTLLGQLYVHIDLANTSEPAQLLVDTGNSLTPLVDDPTINITTGSTDYQLATFTVDTSTLASLTETFSIVQNPTSVIGNTDISAIADGTVTGAIAQINTDLSDLTKPIYEDTTTQTLKQAVTAMLSFIYSLDVETRMRLKLYYFDANADSNIGRMHSPYSGYSGTAISNVYFEMNWLTNYYAVYVENNTVNTSPASFNPTVSKVQLWLT